MQIISKQSEAQILNTVLNLSKNMMETIKFNMIYSMGVSSEQEERTSNDIKKLRAKNWPKALKKAKGNKNKALKYYLELCKS